MKDQPYIKNYLSSVVPAILALAASALYNVVDTYFVAAGTGVSGLAGIGMSVPLIMLIIAIAQAIGTGASIIISQARGHSDIEAASFTAVKSMVLTFILCLALLPVLYLGGGKLFSLIGSGRSEIEAAGTYFFILLFGVIQFASTMVLENISRAMGRGDLALKSLLTGGFCNIVLDYLFIIVFGLGVAGAALATVISQTMALIFNLLWIFGPRGVFQKFRTFSFIRRESKGTYSHMMKYGSPVFLHQLSISSGLFLLYWFLQPEAEEIWLAGVSVIYKIAFLFTLIHIGILQGMQPLLGYYSGQKDIPGIKKTLKMAYLNSLFLSLACIMAVSLFGSQILSVFFKEGVDESLVRGVKIVSLGMLFWPVFMITGGYYLSIRKPLISTFMNVSRNILFLTPCMMISSLYADRFLSLWIGSALADAITAMVGLFFAVNIYNKLHQRQLHLGNNDLIIT